MYDEKKEISVLRILFSLLYLGVVFRIFVCEKKNVNRDVEL